MFLRQTLLIHLYLSSIAGILSIVLFSQIFLFFVYICVSVYVCLYRCLNLAYLDKFLIQFKTRNRVLLVNRVKKRTRKMCFREQVSLLVRPQLLCG